MPVLSNLRTAWDGQLEQLYLLPMLRMLIEELRERLNALGDSFGVVQSIDSEDDLPRRYHIGNRSGSGERFEVLVVDANWERDHVADEPVVLD